MTGLGEFVAVVQNAIGGRAESRARSQCQEEVVEVTRLSLQELSVKVKIWSGLAVSLRGAEHAGV